MTPAARVAGPSLPSPLTSFVGRVAERGALAEVLAGHRLVTAVGPGGVGKTRLALAVAADVTDRYADGAWYVDLVPVTDAAMVGAAVASAFGFGEQPGRSPTDTVVAKLAGAEALVVLDNCEHLVDGVTGFVERLLTDCPKVTRAGDQPGPVAGAVRVRVFGAGAVAGDDGAGDSDAVALFVERAGMAGWSSPYPHDRRPDRGDLRRARRGRPGDRAGRGPAGDLRARRPGGGPGRPVWACWPAGLGSTTGIGRSAPPWTGASACSTRRTRWCCGGRRCSRHRSRSRRRPR